MMNGEQAQKGYRAGGCIAMICGVTSFAGEAPKVDSSTSVEQLKTLAAEGNADAMLEYGERLIQGYGSRNQRRRRHDWFHKAANAGNHQRGTISVFVYSNGLKDTVDIVEAMKYFRKGADLGNADCQTSMGLIYQAGERIQTA